MTANQQQNRNDLNFSQNGGNDDEEMNYAQENAPRLFVNTAAYANINQSASVLPQLPAQNIRVVRVMVRKEIILNNRLSQFSKEQMWKTTMMSEGIIDKKGFYLNYKI